MIAHRGDGENALVLDTMNSHIVRALSQSKRNLPSDSVLDFGVALRNRTDFFLAWFSICFSLKSRAAAKIDIVFMSSSSSSKSMSLLAPLELFKMDVT